jgi:ribose transport system substrate-binding protein
MKKYLIHMLILLLVVSFSIVGIGCKEETAPAEEVAVEEAPAEEAPAEEAPDEEEMADDSMPLDGWVVGYLPGSLIDALRLTWSDKMEETVVAAGGEVITIDSQNDATKQVSDGEDILTQDIDILVINPNDADAMVPIVEQANDAGIPVVCIDRTVSGGDILTTVAFDNWTAGYEAGMFLAEQIGEEGKVMQLQGGLGASVVYERGESFRQAIAEFPDIELVAEPASDGWTAEDGLSFTEDTLLAHPDLKGIWSHADQIIIGAYQAVEEAGKLDDIILVGMGLYSGIPEIIQEGTGMVYTWALLPEEVGTATGDVCIKIAKGELGDIEDVTGTPLIWVDQDNIEDNWKYKLD